MSLNKAEIYENVKLKSEPYSFNSLLDKFNYRYENKYYKNNDNTLDYDVLSNKEKKKFFFELAERRPIFNLTVEFITHLQNNIELQAKILIDVAKIESGEVIYYSNNLLEHIHFFKNYQGKKSDVFSHEAVTSFIENGLDKNFEENGIPLIHYVAMNLNLKTVQYLINEGASIDIIDEAGDGILNCAMNNFQTFEYLFNYTLAPKLEVNNLLLQAVLTGNTKAIDLITHSELMHDVSFIESACVQAPEAIENILINLEKEALEKQIPTNTLKNKIKL